MGGEETGTSTGVGDKEERILNSVKVKAVESLANNVSIVTYKEGRHVARVMVPSDQIEEGEISQDSLEEGVTLWVPWATYFSSRISPTEIERGFQRAGIWTVKDLRERWKKAEAVLGRIFHRMLVKALQKASKDLEG